MDTLASLNSLLRSTITAFDLHDDMMDEGMLDNESIRYLLSKCMMTAYTSRRTLRSICFRKPVVSTQYLESINVDQSVIESCHQCTDAEIEARLGYCSGRHSAANLAVNPNVSARFFVRLYTAGARAFHPNVIDVTHKVRGVTLSSAHTFRGSPREYRRVLRAIGMKTPDPNTLIPRWRFRDLMTTRSNFAWGRAFYLQSTGYTTAAIAAISRQEHFAILPTDSQFICANCNDTIADIDALCGLTYPILFNRSVSTADLIAYAPAERLRQMIDDAVIYFPMRERDRFLTLRQIRLLGDDRLRIYDPDAELDEIRRITGRCTPKMIADRMYFLKRDCHAADVFALIIFHADGLIRTREDQ